MARVLIFLDEHIVRPEHDLFVCVLLAEEIRQAHAQHRVAGFEHSEINGQVRLSAGMGLDLKSLLAGALGGKLAAGNSQPVQVTVAPQAQPDVAAASADTPEQQV